jgi:outer membrane protein insertion porin family/translocation and assembly module TamA
VEIRSIRFEGNTSFAETQLRASILAVATHCRSAALLPLCWFGTSLQRAWFDPRVLAFDSVRVRLFYYRHGFREAQVALDTLREGSGVHVRFLVSEGRPVLVSEVLFEGGDPFPSSLGRGLPLSTGRPLDEIALEATRDSLRTRLQDAGFFHAEVLANYAIERTSPYSARVEYQLLPGPLTRFGEVEVRGAERVDTSLVLRALAFRPGDRYSRTALLHSQRNLFALEVFRHAEIAPLAGPADSVLPVRVLVIEGVQHRFRFGFGATTAEYLNAEGRWLSRNLLGGARRLEATVRIANLIAEPLASVPPFNECSGIYCERSGSVRLDYAQPSFLHPLTTLGAGLFLERVTVPQVYVRTSRGAYTSVLRSFGGGGGVALGYRPELTKLESAEQVFCANFTACEAEDIRLLRESHRLAPITFSYNLERANSLLAPSRGFALRLEGEVAGKATFSEFAYLRGVGELVAYREPFREVVIATRVRGGWARAVGAPGQGLGLHPQRRFFAGGPSSVRGFAQYRLGPKLLTADAARTLARTDSLGAACTPQSINAGECDVSALAGEHPEQLRLQPVGGSVLVEGNLEVRFPLMLERFRGAAFLDVGQVWRAGESVELGRLAWSPGLGVRYFSPIGPVRVDVGYNAAGEERLAVLSTEVCYLTQDPCGPFPPDQQYDPTDLKNGTRLRTQRSVVWDPYDSFTDRLQIHFSIGQAF